ncbi:hypothetical protein H206_05355 [Candidatus Electrothrix aarhusensis]|uniref:Uncharacterized protein n=1 Tax=Candidatus Electrothrix aarhusensis TaxID=1859131 RepID=A0A3S3QI65_9BACT|nr:hypothetical protein H206_05355 [Candidatus Electrothrix aarhusensis]
MPLGSSLPYNPVIRFLVYFYRSVRTTIICTSEIANRERCCCLGIFRYNADETG